MSISKAEVEKIATLARLALSAQETALYQSQLSAILDFAETLNNLDLDGVPPTIHAVSRQNVMREDVIEPSLSAEAVFYNAWAHQEHQFAIQSIFDDPAEQGS